MHGEAKTKLSRKLEQMHWRWTVDFLMGVLGALTGPKLSDGGRKRQAIHAGTPPRRSLERVVRRVGTRSLPRTGTRLPPAGGMTGRWRRESPTERLADAPGRKPRRRSEREKMLPNEGNREKGPCLHQQSREEEHLTDSSSATEAGEEGRNHGTSPTASLCSLERMVRPVDVDHG